MSSLTFFDFFVKLIDNNGYEQVHDEESCQENIDDEYKRFDKRVARLHDLVFSNTIYCIEHVGRPHLKS